MTTRHLLSPRGKHTRSLLRHYFQCGNISNHKLTSSSSSFYRLSLPTLLPQKTQMRNFSTNRFLSSASASTSTTSATTPSSLKVLKELKEYNLKDPECNIPSSIISKLGKNLHLQNKHPLNTIKTMIEEYYTSEYTSFDKLSPIVTTHQNFDVLRIGPDHVSRSKSDTYYLNPNAVLRTHTSAHQVDLLQNGHDCFLVSGDVYRRDEIDSSHYPVFHQMEGVKLFTPQEFKHVGATSDLEKRLYVEQHLKQGLEGMVRHIFGDVEMRWGNDYFPFTHPSYELEIYFREEWMEVLGCGVIHPDILSAANRLSFEKNNDDKATSIGWAFGLGLERLAMILFSIPDIRLFWTEDTRFHSQFESGNIVDFQPYSKYPPCFKDVSFWLSSEFHSNDLMEIVRNITGDLVEQVVLLDEFVHPKTNRTSHCYRISYRSMDRSLTNEEVDLMQMKVREEVVDILGVELR